ncbi:hypothetical protein HOF92_02880 [bacterium]|nr:hypothetical protein [bacterium]
MPPESPDSTPQYPKPVHNRSQREYIKTTVLHLLGTSIFCYFYQGFFLFFFPPLLVFWILLSLILSAVHFKIHQQVRDRYFREDLLTQLWMNPLALLGISIGTTFLIFVFLDAIDKAVITRQILQLSVELFSKFLYVYFLLLFASSTFLFVELCIVWTPRLQPFHFSPVVRKSARKILLILVSSFLLGIYSLFTFQYENILYIKAVLILNLSKDSEQSIRLLQKIPRKREALYLNSQYRIGKILLKRFHRYEDSIGHFQKIIKHPGSPLKDSAILQVVICIFQSGGSSEAMLKFLKASRIQSSCLLDEMYFLLAAKYEQEEAWEKARSLYRDLAAQSYWRFTLTGSYNKEIPSFSRTVPLARKKLLALTYLGT